MERTILENVQTENDFHRDREFALSHPLMAADKLAPYATLSLRVVKARGLMAADLGMFQSGKSDPYAQVLLNDVTQKQTQYVSSTLAPVWNESFTIGVELPGSILQVFVMDYDLMSDNDLLGFVDIPVADLTPGKCVSGWFILSDPASLFGTAPSRLEKALLTPCQERHGAIYLELQLTIISGDLEDEFYAWCLPDPTFKEYPVPEPDGSVKPLAPKALDAQHLIDIIIEIKECIFDYFLVPLTAGCVYVLSWREPLLSLLVLGIVVAVALHPLYLPAGLFAYLAVLLYCTASKERRIRMSADPSLVSLNDRGYELMCELQDTDKMASFIARTVEAMNGQVVNAQKLHTFAAFSYFDSKPVTGFADLQRQLRDSVKELHSDPMVSFKTSPYAAGLLVAVDNKPGEVVCCVNPEEAPNFKYKVHFKDGCDDVTVVGEELELRPDLRFLKNKIVLALIPDSTEDMLMDLAEPLKSILGIVRLASDLLIDIVCWKIFLVSVGSCIGCLSLSLLFWSVVRFGVPLPGTASLIISLLYVLVVVTLVIFLFVRNANWYISLMARIKAHLRCHLYSQKSLRRWPFYEGRVLDPGKLDPLFVPAAQIENSANAQGIGILSCCVYRYKAHGEVPNGSMEEPLLAV